MNIGNTIRNVRKEKGMTLQQIADIMGCSPQLISQYENGKRQPKIETLQKIADALNVPLYELKGFDDSIYVDINPERIKQDAKAEELIKRQALGEDITEEERQKISNYIKRTKESFSHLHKFVGGLKNTIEELGETTMLSDYRKLNFSGKAEAIRRVNELTKIKNYTKPNETSQE